MGDPIVGQILFQVVLIMLNAIFACAEIAVISFNDNRLAQLAAKGDKRAVRLARLTSQPARFLATIQVAITLAGFLGSAFAADSFSDPLVEWLISLGVNLPRATMDTAAVVVITLILSYFTLVFGELVPKRIAMRKAEQVALAISGIVCAISTIFAPIVWLLTVSTNALLRLCGIDPNADDDEVSEEEIRMMVDAGTEKGVIDASEKELIQNVFEFDDITLGEFCTHRTDVAMLWMDEDDEEWISTINSSRHSMYPVCDETVDNIVGILSAREYFRLEDRSRDNVMKKAVRKPYFVPEGVTADVLFRQMQASRNHFAVVLDEYGGTEGIVTMNDLLQQLVGDLDDDAQSPREEQPIERMNSQSWKILGSAMIKDVNELLGTELSTEDYDTFGGLVLAEHGSIPEDSSPFTVEAFGLRIKVLGVRDHKIEKMIVSRLPEEKDGGKGDESGRD